MDTFIVIAIAVVFAFFLAVGYEHNHRIIKLAEKVTELEDRLRRLDVHPAADEKPKRGSLTLGYDAEMIDVIDEDVELLGLL